MHRLKRNMYKGESCVKDVNVLSKYTISIEFAHLLVGMTIRHRHSKEREHNDLRNDWNEGHVGVVDALDNDSGGVDSVENGFKTPRRATASV